jgi:hypothetical protein
MTEGTSPPRVSLWHRLRGWRPGFAAGFLVGMWFEFLLIYVGVLRMT